MRLRYLVLRAWLFRYGWELGVKNGIGIVIGCNGSVILTFNPTVIRAWPETWRLLQQTRIRHKFLSGHR